MSGHEQGGDIRSKIEARTANLANEYGRRAAIKIELVLAPHLDSGLIDEETLAAIMEAEHTNAAAKFKAEREKGLHNDRESNSAGLTAIIKNNGKKRIEYIMANRNVPLDLNAPQFSELPTIDELGEPLYQMTLPTGMYSALRSKESRWSGTTEDSFQISFYTESSVTQGGFAYAGGHEVSAYKLDVIRIEGSEGELWQNQEYTPEGQPVRTNPAPTEI